MTTATDLKFVRTERGSPANRTMRAEGKKHGIIYDFDVWHSGVRIATWLKSSRYGRGYLLYDAAGAPVRAPWIDEDGTVRVDDPEHYWQKPASCESQGGFALLTRLYLPYIPTAEQIAQRQEAKRAADEQRAAEEQEARRIATIKEAAIDTLAALETVQYNNAMGITGRRARDGWAQARAAIAKAKGGAA